MRLSLAMLRGWSLLLFVGVSYLPASNGSVPPPSTDPSHRFGVYNWNIDDRAYTGSPNDRLNWGADWVAASGSKTIRVFFGPRDIYHLKNEGPESANTLTQLAKTTAYDKLFRDPRFSTYIMTAYTYSSRQNRWVDGFTQVEYDAERFEIRALGQYLLENPAFSGKTFIVINWEGDNEMYEAANRQSAWDAYLSFVEARADAVREARVAVSSSEANLFSGLEFNLVRSRTTNQTCGTLVADPVNEDPLKNRCVIDYIAPRATVDYYSYSAWQSVTDVYLNSALDFADVLKADIRLAVALVRTRRPEITEANFLIGEYGFERARLGECHSAELVARTFEAVNGPSGLGVSYAIFWQVVDNANLYGNLDDRFGLLKTISDGTTRTLSWTLAGHAFKDGLGTRHTFQGPTNCPGIIRPPQGWGVVDAATGLPLFRLNPDSELLISSDGPFSATGNTVRFAQSGSKSDLTRANGGITGESGASITARLPSVRRPGDALVYVSNNSSVDSNAQAIHILCAECPKISPVCGVVNRRYQTEAPEPGAAIAIRGDFQPDGNSVLVEQHLEGGVPVTTSINHDANWSESTAEITATLPTNLIRNRDASVTVVDKDGRHSASLPIFVPISCSDCAPAISPCLNYFSNERELHPGTIVSIPGNFPRSGNRAIIEYYNPQRVLLQQSLSLGSRGWSETDSEIRAGIPLQIQPGRAIIYLVDSAGRESLAWNIRVTPATLAVVSAASFRPLSATPGGIMAGFGNALATATAVGASIPLPTVLGGTTVVVRDSAGVERESPLFFVSPQQVNFQIPPESALGQALITVQSSDGAVSQLATTIVRAEPGIFAANADGVGAPAGDFVHVAEDTTQRYQSTVELDSESGRYVPAQVAFGPEPDQLFLILYGTGFRLIASPEMVQARLDGISCEVTYSGAHGVFVGMDQINMRLPRTLIGRGLISVEVIVESRVANVLEVWIK